ncbi:hypothetical protein KC320_g204 [Hortaea werneckii]|nr:hypothetical protein KC320_g204 [Hortaea werneckii]
MTAAMENGPLGRAVQVRSISEGRIWHIVPEHTSLVHRTDVRYRRGGISLAPWKAIPEFFLHVGKHCARSLAKEASWKPCTGRHGRDVGRDLGTAISLSRRTALLTKTNKRWTPSPSPETCSFCQWKSKPSQSPAVLPRRNATTALRLRWEVFQFQLEQIPSNTARKWWT